MIYVFKLKHQTIVKLWFGISKEGKSFFYLSIYEMWNIFISNKLSSLHGGSRILYVNNYLINTKHFFPL